MITIGFVEKLTCSSPKEMTETSRYMISKYTVLNNSCTKYALGKSNTGTCTYIQLFEVDLIENFYLY